MTKVLKESVNLGQGLLFSIHHYRNFKFLSAQAQYNQVTIWFEGEHAEANHKKHRFQLIPTGDYVPDNATYLSTIQLQDGQYVHLYQL